MSIDRWIDVAPVPWSGRVDGEGPEYLRWHQAVRPIGTTTEDRACVLVGFASDEGVRRNKGRIGAAQGPTALRKALAPLALPEPMGVADAGDITVHGGDVEGSQRALGNVVAELLHRGRFVVVLGGGHEVAYGSYLGLRSHYTEASIGVLNVDAHFDLRATDIPSSGTAFRQMLEAEAADRLRYAVVGISQPSNSTRLFRAAADFAVRYLMDDDCGIGNRSAVTEFVDYFVGSVDVVHLSIDLDVLPAAIAPGVSAPAAFGVPVEIVQAVCDRVAASGKLALVDIAELNPDFDIDARTARVGARLIHRIVCGRRGIGE